MPGYSRMIFSTNDIDFLKELMPVQNLRNTFALHYKNIIQFLHQIRFETVQSKCGIAVSDGTSWTDGIMVVIVNVEMNVKIGRRHSLHIRE